MADCISPKQMIFWVSGCWQTLSQLWQLSSKKLSIIVILCFIIQPHSERLKCKRIRTKTQIKGFIAFGEIYICSNFLNTEHKGRPQGKNKQIKKINQSKNYNSLSILLKNEGLIYLQSNTQKLRNLQNFASFQQYFKMQKSSKSKTQTKCDRRIIQKKLQAQKSTKKANISPACSEEESFRYYRYKKLTIKHIGSDSENNQDSNFCYSQISAQPQTYFSVTSQPNFENVVLEKNIKEKILHSRIDKTKENEKPPIYHKIDNLFNNQCNQKPLDNVQIRESQKNQLEQISQKQDYYSVIRQHNFEPDQPQAIIDQKQPKSSSIVAKNIQQKAFQYYLQKYRQPLESKLLQKSIQTLKSQKIESYNQIFKFLIKFFEGNSIKNILYVYGSKQTGKKTLVFQAIKQVQFKCKKIYLDYSSLNNNPHAKTLSLYNYLKINSEESKAESQKPRLILIVNNVQIFFYFLKKTQIYHQFKHLVKKRLFVLVFIDKLSIDMKQLSWISQKILTIHMPNNTKALFAALLIECISNGKELENLVTIPKPLANLFSIKLSEQNCLQLGIIEKFTQFLNQKIEKSKAERYEQGIKEVNKATFKVCRQHIQEFRHVKLGIKRLIQLQNLNLQQKIFLVACFLYLKENDQVAISLVDLQKQNKWVCESLSIEAKNLKELERDVITNLETYRVIKILKEFGSRKEKHILLNIDLNKIRQELGHQLFLKKFFQEKG